MRGTVPESVLSSCRAPARDLYISPGSCHYLLPIFVLNKLWLDNVGRKSRKRAGDRGNGAQHYGLAINEQLSSYCTMVYHVLQVDCVSHLHVVLVKSI